MIRVGSLAGGADSYVSIRSRASFMCDCRCRCSKSLVLKIATEAFAFRSSFLSSKGGGMIKNKRRREEPAPPLAVCRCSW